MRVLVTRPEPDASETAARLRTRGHDVVVDPMLSIGPVAGAAVPGGPFQAVLLTSANPLRVGLDLLPLSACPVYAVGSKTAARAREAGFASVIAGPGDADDLAALVRLQCDPAAGPLLYLAGIDRSGDLDGALRAAGFDVRLTEVYRADPAGELAPGTRAALEFGNLDSVLVASRRTGEAFLSAVDRHNLRGALSRIAAVVISPQVGRAMERAPFARVVIASEPTEEGLLACIEQMSEGAEERRGMGQGSAGKGRKRNAAAASQDALPAALAPSSGVVERAAAPPSPFATAPLVWADMTAGAPHLPAVAPPPRAASEPAKPAEAKPAEAAPMAEASASKPVPAPEPPPAPRAAATVSAPPAPAVRSEGSGFGRALAAGLVGAVLAGGAVLAAAMSGYVPGLARSADTAPQLRALTERVTAVEALRPRLEGAERAAVLRGEVDQLKTALAAVQERVASLAASQPVGATGGDSLARDVARLSEAVTALDKRVEGLDLAPLQSGLQELRNNVASLAQASAASERSERAAALTLAVSALRAAVARGGPFQTELQAVRALGLDGDAIRALATAASSGAPGTARLLERLRAAARPMIDATQPAPESTFDRLTQAAGRLVSVRPTGEVEGTTVTAIVARIEARLQRGDISGAATEFETLAPAAQAAGQAFAADLRARLETERHIRVLSDDISKLAPPRG